MPPPAAAQQFSQAEMDLRNHCRYGRWEEAKKIFEADPGMINVQILGRRSPLHHAAEHGDPEVVCWLLDARADPALATKNDKKTPLDLATKPDVQKLLKPREQVFRVGDRVQFFERGDAAGWIGAVVEQYAPSTGTYTVTSGGYSVGPVPQYRILEASADDAEDEAAKASFLKRKEEEARAKAALAKAEAAANNMESAATDPVSAVPGAAGSGEPSPAAAGAEAAEAAAAAPAPAAGASGEGPRPGAGVAAPSFLWVWGAGAIEVNGQYALVDETSWSQPVWKKPGKPGSQIRWGASKLTWVLGDNETINSSNLYCLEDKCEDDIVPLGARWSCESAAGPAPSICYLPPWLSGRTPQGKAKRPSIIRDTAQRGISVKQVDDLATCIEDAVASYCIRDHSPHSPTRGQDLRWKTITMYDVCTYFIQPLTCRQQCSYVESLGTGTKCPTWMISHWWGCPFAETVSMLRRHEASRSGCVYWMCTLANNQWNLEELQEDRLLRTPFARVLTNEACVGTLLLCDSSAAPMRRCWCVFETYLTDMLRHPPDFAPADVRGKQGLHLFDIAACVQQEDRPVGESVGMLLDAFGGSWHECTSSSGVRFPLDVATAGVNVDISRATAAVVRDKNKIMNYIALKRAVARDAPESHVEYDRLNIFVHSIFYSAELFRVCAEMTDGCVEQAQALLLLRADPNKFVRQGETPLFAVVRAEPPGGSTEGGEDDGGEGAALSSSSGQLGGDQRRVVDLLLAARADPNVANAALKTVLECASSPELAEYLRRRGAKDFQSVSQQLAGEANSALHDAVARGFPHVGSAFKGGGAGGIRAELTLAAAGSLRAAAGLLKRYPLVPCHVTVRQDHRLPPHRAQKEAQAQLRTVERALRSDSCRNPLCGSVTSANLPAFLQLTIDFTSALAAGTTKLHSHLLDRTAQAEADELRQVFEDWDADGNGSISKEELSRVLLDLLPNFTAKDVDTMLSAFDADGNGNIDYSEFASWLQR